MGEPVSGGLAPLWGDQARFSGERQPGDSGSSSAAGFARTPVCARAPKPCPNPRAPDLRWRTHHVPFERPTRSSSSVPSAHFSRRRRLRVFDRRGFGHPHRHHRKSDHVIDGRPDGRLHETRRRRPGPQRHIGQHQLPSDPGHHGHRGVQPSPSPAARRSLRRGLHARPRSDDGQCVDNCRLGRGCVDRRDDPVRQQGGEEPAGCKGANVELAYTITLAAQAHADRRGRGPLVPSVAGGPSDLLLILLVAPFVFGGAAYAMFRRHFPRQARFALSVSPSTQTVARGGAISLASRSSAPTASPARSGWSADCPLGSARGGRPRTDSGRGARTRTARGNSTLRARPRATGTRASGSGRRRRPHRAATLLLTVARPASAASRRSHARAPCRELRRHGRFGSASPAPAAFALGRGQGLGARPEPKSDP